jgi:hypothetical protein
MQWGRTHTGPAAADPQPGPAVSSLNPGTAGREGSEFLDHPVV